MSSILIRELKRGDMMFIADLFNEHKGSAFVYPSDIQLFKVFYPVRGFKGFVGEVGGRIIGCVYALRHLCGCGWIGGLLVHRDFRRLGVGTKLLDAALNFLGCGYTYLFVIAENSVARGCFEKMGFRALYRRLNFSVEASQVTAENVVERVAYGVEWNDIVKAMGFEERSRVANLGYYPVKVTEPTFGGLKRDRKLIKAGNVLAIVENSFCVEVEGEEFVFSKSLLDDISGVVPKRKVVEVNPFYIKPESADLGDLVNHLAEQGDVNIWTYEGDPVATKLPQKGSLGAVAMEIRTA